MLNRLRLWLRARFFSRRLDREMRDEMADHLARIVERMMAQGMARGEAERAARREFGNLNVLREEARDARGGRRLESLAADVRFGLRQFARRPVSTITMIVVLALGIGFNSALFVLVSSFVRGVPAGFTPDESLVRIRGIDRNQSRGFALGREFSYLGVRRVRRANGPVRRRRGLDVERRGAGRRTRRGEPAERRGDLRDGELFPGARRPSDCRRRLAVGMTPRSSSP